MPELIVCTSRQRLRLYRRSGWPRTVSRLLDERPLSADAWPTTGANPTMVQELSALLDNQHDTDIRFIVPDHGVRYFMSSAPRNARSIGDCAAATTLRFREIFGESPDAWRIAADWDAGHPYLACALPLTLLDALQQIAQTQRLRLAGVVPHFVAAWNQGIARRDDAWFATLHDNCLTLAAVAAGRLCGVRCVALPPDALNDADWLTQLLAREALRLNQPPPRNLDVRANLPVHAAWGKQATNTLSIHWLPAGDPA